VIGPAGLRDCSTRDARPTPPPQGRGRGCRCVRRSLRGRIRGGDGGL